MGVPTKSAMVLAFAPGYEARTTTVGGVMDGYSSMGKLRKETKPAMMIRIESTVANMGRLIKKLLNFAKN